MMGNINIPWAHVFQLVLSIGLQIAVTVKTLLVGACEVDVDATWVPCQMGDSTSIWVSDCVRFLPSWLHLEDFINGPCVP